MGNNVSMYGKIAKFPKNTKAKSAYNFLTNLKISSRKLWYFIIEKEIVSVDGKNKAQELQLIKYNNKNGINCDAFIEILKKEYPVDTELGKYINNLIIDSEENFSVIRNIPDVEIGGKKLINIISEDIIRLLYDKE
jgi:hypothetical protein